MNEEIDGEVNAELGKGDLEEARPPKPGTFQKGDPRINRSGAPRRDESTDAPVPLLLRDLRHVYNRSESTDKTQGQCMLRKLFKKNPEKFVYRLQKAEAEYRAEAKQQVVTPEPVEEVDEPLERGIDLVKEMLAEKGWNKATCP